MRMTTHMLSDKNVIIYGGGALGGGIARTFAREGAAVFVAGRNAAVLDKLAGEIRADGGSVATTVLDVLDEAAVAAHLDAVGRVDVSFNLVSRGDVQGRPLLEMAAADFARPVDQGIRGSFITAQAAARRMVAQGSGVILHLTSGSSQGTAPGMGGTGPADAALETFMRYLAAEVGPAGVRVAGIWTAAVSETLTLEKLRAVGGDNVPDPELVKQMIGQAAALRRAPEIAQVADTAVFLASDRAAGITSSIVNVTCGLVL